MKILVTVVYRSKGEKCEAACGLDWSSAETLNAIKKRVNERFGDIVDLELIDISLNGPSNTWLITRIKKNNLSLPLLLVNNEVRISGEFDARQLMDSIEVEKELKWKMNTT